MELLILAMVILAADRVTKLFVTELFVLGESLPVVEDVLHWTYVMNKGAAFGMLEGSRWLFIVIAVLTLCAVYYFREDILQRDIMTKVGITCFAAGALGNLIDRIFFGGVIDFIDFRIWPVFNVADMGVCFGVACVIWSVVWKKEL